MGRRVRCHLDVDDPEAFLTEAREFFLDEGYEIERDDLPELLILHAGNAAWTVVGTHRWSKTSRTLIASTAPDDDRGTVELLYDVSWLSIHYRPQGKIVREIEELLDRLGESDLEIRCEYDTQI